MIKGLFWKVDLAVESASGTRSCLCLSGRGRKWEAGLGQQVVQKMPLLHPAHFASFPIILASAFCCPLFPGTLKIWELSKRDRYENGYPSQNKIRAIREIQVVNRLNDSSWSGSGIRWHLKWALQCDLIWPNINSGNSDLGSNPSSPTFTCVNVEQIIWLFLSLIFHICKTGIIMTFFSLVCHEVYLRYYM